MDLGLKGKTAIVCASSRGLGKGCAMALAEAGCDIVVNGRNEETLNATAGEIRSATGASVTAVSADVSTAEGQKALLAACPEPDILINNNGGPPPRKFTELGREEIIEGVIQNMITPIELLQASIGAMRQKGFGRIINITSLSVVMPIEGLDLSSGARAGLTSFLAGVCREVAGDGVTINQVLPGKMDTDRLRTTVRNASKARGLSEEDFIAQQQAEIPAHRYGNAEEFGKVCAFLCSVHAGYITGQNIKVDGGLVPYAF
ncbi:SDR family oxidoreductase [Rhodobium gokarnense]|uniref:3-oxoacyl-[acyl-carrier protein] reductase n=1 Tax=Rhodobium gokarnense TaxID=364296 RepID=A0ABT3HIM0_9HYPH|nr:SDR family oxidoreductase [Rhodobium gokarnense]MCW2310248.1 3-oxoacyl-[acyl-carrier protein] reductase [Rhodobium gokarnense]